MWLPGITAVGAALEGAIFQKDVNANGEHWIGDVVWPSEAGRARNVRPSVYVPAATAVPMFCSGLVAPTGIGNDVAVFAQERLDDVENLASRYQTLRGGGSC